MDRARLAVHKANMRTLEALGATKILADSDTYLDETTYKDRQWKVEGEYDFSSKTFTSIDISAGTGTPSAEGSDGAKTADADIGKIPTSGTVTYTVYLTEQNLTT